LSAAHRDKTMTLIDLNYRSGKRQGKPLQRHPDLDARTVPWAAVAARIAGAASATGARSCG
jgi:hypothetical protein